MKQWLDFMPLAVFGGAYVLADDIYTATAALMVATALQLVLMRLLVGRIGGQLWTVAALVMVFGGMTLVFHDKSFLLWKPTLFNWLLGGFLAGAMALGRNPLGALLGGQLTLPAHAWRVLTYGWALGCFVEGAANLFVAYRFSEGAWVAYKLWSGFAFTALFIALSAWYISRGGFLAEHRASSDATAGLAPVPVRNTEPPRHPPGA